jgi:excisionase family DNA binding protein
MNPFSVKTLADRWECHPDVVRRLIRKGDLKSFRVGALIRVSRAEVERYECSGSGSHDTGADLPLSSTTIKDATAERSTRELWRQRTQRQAT